jgi:hypothetical protein
LAQGLEARQRRKHAHRLLLDEPSGVTIGSWKAFRELLTNLYFAVEKCSYRKFDW